VNVEAARTRDGLALLRYQPRLSTPPCCRGMENTPYAGCTGRTRQRSACKRVKTRFFFFFLSFFFFFFRDVHFCFRDRVAPIERALTGRIVTCWHGRNVRIRTANAAGQRPSPPRQTAAAVLESRMASHRHVFFFFFFLLGASQRQMSATLCVRGFIWWAQFVKNRTVHIYSIYLFITCFVPYVLFARHALYRGRAGLILARDCERRELRHAAGVILVSTIVALCAYFRPSTFPNCFILVVGF
jgi:hypothetical protein